MANEIFSEECLKEIVEKMKDYSPPSLLDFMYRSNYLGTPVFEVRECLIPKIQISENCPVSDEFRAKANAWYVEMFGYKDQRPFIQDGYIFHTSYGMYTNTRTHKLIVQTLV